MNKLVRLWAWLLGREKNLVWLLDYNGVTTLSIARRNQFGQLVAERYPFHPGIYTVVLLNHGLVRAYQSSYVVRWVSDLHVKSCSFN